MAPTQENLPIYRRFPGPNTGDERIQTVDGEVWEVVSRLPERGTGDRHALLINGQVREI